MTNTIEAKLRKELRMGKYFKSSETVYLYNDYSKEYAVLKYLLNEIFNKRLDIKELKAFPSKTSKKVLVGWNMDREINEKLDCFLKDKDFPKEKGIRLMKSVPEGVIERFAVQKKLKFKPKQEKKNKMIEEMHKRHPQTKFSLLKSFEYIERELK
ncbi:MAG: hypothetical protein ABIE94_01340 [archaeon]